MSKAPSECLPSLLYSARFSDVWLVSYPDYWLRVALGWSKSELEVRCGSCGSVEKACWKKGYMKYTGLITTITDCAYWYNIVFILRIQFLSSANGVGVHVSVCSFICHTFDVLAHCQPNNSGDWLEAWTHSLWDSPGARSTNDFLPAIQIRWKIRLAVIPLLAIRSQQSFAHATTAKLSCLVQNFVAITVFESRWEWNEISIKFEFRWKNR